MKINGMLHVLAFTLVLVGAANWGLVGLFDFNLVTSLGLSSGIVQIVYILVGVSAVYLLLMHQSECKTCMTMMKKGKK